jgi:hypothetical protein
MAWDLDTEVLPSELSKGMELQYRYLSKKFTGVGEDWNILQGYIKLE